MQENHDVPIKIVITLYFQCENGGFVREYTTRPVG